MQLRLFCFHVPVQRTPIWHPALLSARHLSTKDAEDEITRTRLINLMTNPRLSPLMQSIDVPSAETHHPGALERNRVSEQNGKHFQHCVQLLNKAVWDVDSREALFKLQTQKKTGRLGFVDRSVIDKAISILPSSVQGDVRQAYEIMKMNQYQHYGTQTTMTTHRPSVEAHRRRQLVIDDRLIALRGKVTLSNGEQCHFMGDDVDKETLLRVAWDRGQFYSCRVRVSNGNFGKLALLLKELQFRENSPGRYSIFFSIDDENVITGKHATLLRDRGLDVRVVQVPGELDNKSKREQELERRKSSDFRLKRLQNALSSPTQNKIKRPLSAFQFFSQSRGGLKERVGVLHQAFDRLTPQVRREYEDKAEMDQLRFDTERRTAKPKTSYQIFCAEKGEMLVQQYPDKYASKEGQAKLTIDLKPEWLRLGPSGWSEYEQKLENLHFNRNALDFSLNLLGKAVQDVDAHEALQAHRINFRSWLARVSPPVVATAIASLPSGVQADARMAYEKHVKAVKDNRKRRVVLDDRFISIRGVATLSNGERCEFQDYDGTEGTLMRVALHKSNRFLTGVNTRSINVNTRNLALVLRDSKLALNRFTLVFNIDDDNVIFGSHADLLRARGLELRVVQLPGELDYKVKRQQELDRREGTKQKRTKRARIVI